MTKKELKKLKDFRARLVLARDWEKKRLLYKWDNNVLDALDRQGITASDEVVDFVFSNDHDDIRKSVAELFALSIADLDKQIAEGK